MMNYEGCIVELFELFKLSNRKKHTKNNAIDIPFYHHNYFTFWQIGGFEFLRSHSLFSVRYVCGPVVVRFGGRVGEEPSCLPFSKNHKFEYIIT